MASYQRNGMTVVNDVLTKYAVANQNASERELVVPEGVVAIAADAFSQNRVGITKLTLPASFARFDANAFSNSCLNSVSVSSANKKFKVQCGCLIDVTTSTLVLASNSFFSASTPHGDSVKHERNDFFNTSVYLTNYIVPSVKYIGNRAFAYISQRAAYAITLPKGLFSIGAESFFCAKICGAILPDGLTSIGPRAFKGSSLFSIDIPQSVTTLGDEAFMGCRGMGFVSIRGEIKNWGKNIFDSTGNSQTQMTIKSTSVGDRALGNYSGKIHLTAALKSLGERALGRPCLIYAHTTLAQWNAVRKGKDNVYTYVRCTDGKTGTGGYNL